MGRKKTQRWLARWELLRSHSGAWPRSTGEIAQVLLLLDDLRVQGWQGSISRGRPQLADGTSVPWMTYPAIYFLEGALRDEMRLFEYGSGGSTAWFAERVKEVTAVEADRFWLLQVPRAENIRLRHVETEADWYTDSRTDYVQAAVDGAPWDVIVIDGHARNDCAQVAGSLLTPTGFIVLDDTHNPRLAPAQSCLSDQGFGRIDFAGYRPGLAERGVTSIFSRDFNSILRPSEDA